MTVYLSISILLAFQSLLAQGRPLSTESQLNIADEAPAPEFLLQLHRCLKARDDGDNLSDMQCLPEVFEDQDELIDAIHSNTVWGFVGNVSSNNETSRIISFEINQESLHDTFNSLDLRVYKNIIEQKDIVNTCDLNQSVQLSLYTATSNKTLIQNINLTYDGLQQEKWLAFRSLKAFYNSWLSSNSSGNFTVQLEISSEGCDELTLENIGISAQTGKEPLLIVYAQRKPTNDEEMLKHLLEQSADANREKRQLESSGTFPIQETFQCSLQNYNVSYSTINSFLDGEFELNYCAGQCIYPLSSRQSIPHSEVLVYLQIFSTIPPPPPPCCVPIKYQSLTVLIVETRNSYVLYTYENMTASRCGCR